MTTKEFIKCCEDKALQGVLLDLENKGFMVATFEAIKQNINKNSYHEFAKVIAKSLNISLERIAQDNRLHNYLTDLSKDITHQYNARHGLMNRSDLKFEWFVYVGSNLTNTRAFCLAMTEKRYFHKCEIRRILDGEFPEFEKQHDALYEEEGSISGMYEHTNEDTFFIYRGGYGCGHSIMPTSDLAVPEDVKQKLYESEEYKIWKKNN